MFYQTYGCHSFTEERLERDHTGEVDDSVPVVIDAEQGVKLECGTQAMNVTMDPAALLGLSLNDLEPLKRNCAGFTRVEQGGLYMYTIPLSDCGADVKVSLTNTSN